MSEPYGLMVPETCANCTAKNAGFFCNLSTDAMQALDAAKYASAFPRGAVLFVEGQMAAGVSLICQGRVKLAMNSHDGRGVILKVVGSGEILGLSAAVSGKAYELSAETLDPCQISFIKRGDFLRLMREHPEISFRVIEQLSAKYNFACREIRSLGLSRCAAEKFAKLLLDWSSSNVREVSKRTINITFTHDEIAQMIGCSRETVTRLFTDFKRKQLVQMHGCSLVIQNKPGLERIAA
jgi:CRP/FNR family cyclic AMP-dependent transcriptional regulator